MQDDQYQGSLSKAGYHTDLRNNLVSLGLERRNDILDGAEFSATFELNGLGDREDSESQDEGKERSDAREQHGLKTAVILKRLAQRTSRQSGARLLPIPPRDVPLL